MTQKSEICMTKLYVLARAHVLHCSRVFVTALRPFSRRRRINMSLVSQFYSPSRAGHFLPKIEFGDELNRYFGVTVASDYFCKVIRHFLLVTCIRQGKDESKFIGI